MIGLDSLPHLNAFLNALSAVLICMGYLAIRKKKEQAHQRLMITAGIVSAAFLTSYLIYHFNHPVTKFKAKGPVQYVYYFILFTHIILAVINLPMIIITFYRALKGQFEKHRRIARWTFPIWLYVSVTGVVVYVMLYHLYRNG